ncbi:MAG: histidinol-phosphate transaminase [Chloroflexota bacterium]|nr:histidinol-phosphate transaminase [Chloroflexota bacterium]
MLEIAYTERPTVAPTPPIVPDPRLTIRPELLTLAEYHPVATPAQVAAELGIAPEAILKLDANENPYGAPPGVAAALAALDPSRYPDADAGELRAALAAYTGQPPANIVCGNGSDELLELLCRLFIAPGDTVITAEPTFGMYAIAARQHGGRVVDVPRDPATFAVDTVGIIQAAAQPGVRLIFLCAPNNPTGNPLPATDLRAILEAAPCPVVLDEAYAEFAGGGALHLLATHPHLIILRTLSKLGGLAGLRLGYALGSPAIIRTLWRVKAPYNVNAAAQVAGVAALREWPWIAERLARIQAGRDVLAAGLAAWPGLHVYPSAANFLLVRVTAGQAAADAIYAGLRAQGILIRRYGPGPLGGCLRISVGTEAQNGRVLQEVQQLCLTR